LFLSQEVQGYHSRPRKSHPFCHLLILMHTPSFADNNAMMFLFFHILYSCRGVQKGS